VLGLVATSCLGVLAGTETATSQTGERGRLRDRVEDPQPMEAGARVERVVEVSGTNSAAVVEAAGGTVLETVPGGVEARLTGEELVAVEANPRVDAVTPAPELRPHVVSQGVGGIDADDWHLGGTDGTGVDVAVVDLGFAGYADLVAAGELPAGMAVVSGQCAGGIQGSDHGTAVAEIVHDVAPGATLHLICVDSPLDLDSPSDATYAYLRNNDIDVVNASIGVTTASRMDGGGAVDRAVAQSRRTARCGRSQPETSATPMRWPLRVAGCNASSRRTTTSTSST